MTIDDIKVLIGPYGSRTLELKKTTSKLNDGMHSACAFLNSSKVVIQYNSRVFKKVVNGLGLRKNR